MPKLPATRSEAVFADAKPAYTPVQALTEANRCLYCADAPCVQACPTAINIPEFIRKIATGNLRGSARTIFDANIFGMSCARVCPVEVLCVGKCVYNEMDVPPIQIGKLQRYATDAAYADGERFAEAGPDTGKKVALLGGGPASLAAAHELRRQGHACTIFEQGDRLGGLSSSGVAPYKMKADRALEEVEWVLGIGGVELRCGVRVGVDVTVDQLLADFDAVFIGVGLGPDRLFHLDGAELAGIRGAVDWIAEMKTAKVPCEGIQRAIVIGGGNTAVDAVRELLGLGIPEVTMAYRGGEDEMSGYEHEWAAAKVAGARAAFRVQPIAYEGEEGAVRAVRMLRLDAARRPLPGTEHSMPAELVLLAIGQSRLGELFAGVQGVTLDHGKVVVDHDGATQHPKIFAGGDCANGGKEVVNAVAEGKRAAQAIDRLLRGGKAS
ncbi:MAG: FAD-dependent oxidoreductase [Myxococcales bacterium]|nr:FAD-dependent oxidoreductase [Myxococcales bacterium]MCB9704299.1 FAD-dependent oxidoreductase [Myxococcales bacterium]